jgi:hypothetical protein
MANGLIGGFGSFGQTQGQTQGNLLGGVFQQQPTRGELRRGLLSNIVQQYGGNAQQTGGAAIGAGLGIGISKLLGRDVQGAERADKIRRVQERVNSQFGDQFASDPYTAFTGTAQALFDEGLTQEAFAALGEAAQYKPEPVEMEPATFYNLNTDEYVQGAYANGIPVDPRTSQPLGQNFVERDFETPEGPGEYKTFYSADGETSVQARVEGNKLVTLGGEDITGQNFSTSRGGPLVSTDRSEENITEAALENAKQIQERNVALAGVVRSTNDILTLAEQSKGTSLGVVGDIVRIGQGLTAQAQTAANAMGFSLDPDNYDFGAFPDAASKEAAQRTETLALAYNILRAREPQARQFSNADIQNTLDTIGGNSGSYQQLYSQLSQVVRGSLSSATESYQSQVRTFENSNVQAPPSPTDYLNNLESPIAGVSYDIPLFTQYGDLQERRAAEDFVSEAVDEGSLPPNTSLGNFNPNTDSFEVLDEKGNVVQELQMERGQ